MDDDHIHIVRFLLLALAFQFFLNDKQFGKLRYAMKIRITDELLMASRKGQGVSSVVFVRLEG